MFIDPNRPSTITSSKLTPPAIATLETSMRTFGKLQIWANLQMCEGLF